MEGGVGGGGRGGRVVELNGGGERGTTDTDVDVA